MKVFGSISRLVSILFRKDSQDITLRPNQSTTYSAARDIQLPAGDADHELVGVAASQTLTNKVIDGDDNTLQDIGLASLKVALGDADKVLLRDVSGAVVSAKLENKHVASNAAIDFSKMAALTASKVLVSDVNGVVTASSVTSTELGYLSGVTSGIQAQIDTKASSASLSSAVSDIEADIAALTTADIAEDPSNKYFTDARAKTAVVMDTGYVGTETDRALSVKAVTDAFADVNTALDNETDLREAADSALAVDLAAEETRALAAEADLQDAIDDEIADRAAAVSSEASARAAADSAEETARIAADSALQSELDATQTGAGLGSSGSYTAYAQYHATNAPAGAHYIHSATSLKDADKVLDAALKAEADSRSSGDASTLASAQAYADQKISDLVAGAPALLDTLNELAAAIGDDENFVTTITTSISNEASARQDADDDLQDAIDAEEAARIAADSSLQSNIDLKLNKPTSGDSSGKVLKSNGDGSTYWAEQFSLALHKTDWITADGASKTVTHNLNTTDVVVTLVDKSDNQVIGIQSITITSANVVTLAASEAPSASGWRVIVQGL